MHIIRPILKCHQVLIQNDLHFDINAKLDLELKKKNQKLVPRLNHA